MFVIAALSIYGPQKVLSLYFLAILCSNRRVTYALTSGRPVSLPVVKAVSVVMGAICAPLTISLCLPACRQALGYRVDTLRLLLPIGISALIQFLAATSALKKEPRSTIAQPGTEREYLRPYLNQDYAALTTLYRILFVLAGLTSIFIPSSLENQCLITASLIIFCLQSAFEMRRLGYVTTRKALSTSLIILLGTYVIGPVPVYISTWYWRENVIHRLSK